MQNCISVFICISANMKKGKRRKFRLHIMSWRSAQPYYKKNISTQCKKIILCLIDSYLVFQSHWAGRGFSLSQFVRIIKLRKPLSQGVCKKWIWEGNIWTFSLNMKKKLILLLFVTFTNGGKLCNDTQS